MIGTDSRCVMLKYFLNNTFNLTMDFWAGLKFMIVARLITSAFTSIFGDMKEVHAKSKAHFYVPMFPAALSLTRLLLLLGSKSTLSPFFTATVAL